MKKFLIPVILVLIFGLSSIGLAEYHIYFVSHGGPSDPFWVTVIKGVNEAASQFGVKVTYLAPTVYSLNTFLNDLDNAISAKPDGLIVTMIDATAETAPLDRAIAEGIPVIAVNVPDPRPAPKAVPYLLYIGDSEYLAGQTAARYALSQFKIVRAVVASHEITNEGLLMRTAGIEDILGQYHIPCAVLNITTNPITAESVLEAYLKSHPDTNMIFTLGPLGTSPAVQVVKNMGLENKVKIGGFDLTDQLLNWVKDGTILYTIDQQQYLQGYLSVEFMYFYLKHDLIPVGSVLTGPFVITKANVDKVEQSVKDGFR
ncbi:MAG: sugar ABC transporter substrate-binding protein [Candidatus Parvarchaeota archaeon]|nr:sugar ABC transporter substrate-binding protein [Candidatus Jingweiarchaeum tengchongense]MCW1305939.1 sugar ABC transporter substrate-binding protein [Candidatus Jingweiarchaeum tengchongense]